MIEIKTKYYGNSVVTQEDILTFKIPIIGFEHLKQFVLLPVKTNNMFFYLQSIEETRVCFLVSSPFNFFTNYEFEIDGGIEDVLKTEDPSDLVVLNIMNIRNNATEITMNLVSPIIINSVNNTSVQLVLADDKYSVRQPVKLNVNSD